MSDDRSEEMEGEKEEEIEEEKEEIEDISSMAGQSQ